MPKKGHLVRRVSGKNSNGMAKGVPKRHHMVHVSRTDVIRPTSSLLSSFAPHQMVTTQNIAAIHSNSRQLSCRSRTSALFSSTPSSKNSLTTSSILRNPTSSPYLSSIFTYSQTFSHIFIPRPPYGFLSTFLRFTLRTEMNIDSKNTRYLSNPKVAHRLFFIEDSRSVTTVALDASFV